MGIQFDKQRLRIVIGLCVGFSLGLFFLSGIFIRDFPRLDWIHQVAIWIGDGLAILAAFNWAIIRNPDVNEKEAAALPEYAKGVRFDRQHNLTLALTLFVGLLFDLGCTAHGFWTEYNAFKRKIPAIANVIDAKKLKFGNDVATYFELTVEFKDESGQTNRSKLDFIRQINDGPPAWVSGDLFHELDSNQKISPIDIAYDPEHPARIWSKRQPWNRENSVHYIFVIIHLFQGMTTLGLIASLFDKRNKVLSNGKSPIDTLQIAPFCVEVFALVFFGFLFWIRGF